MASYVTELIDWGETGSAPPAGYSYTGDVPPVEEYDDHAMYHAIKDIKHLLSLTNTRLESSSGTTAAKPASPEDGELYWNTTDQYVEIYDATFGGWRSLARKSVLDGHISATNNPHSVTAAQAGAIADADYDPAMIRTGTLANKPVAGTVGRWYFTTDNNGVYYDDGVAWQLTADHPTNVTLGDLSDVTATGEGAGGGFDADTVDGMHASAFATFEQVNTRAIVDEWTYNAPASTLGSYTRTYDVVDGTFLGMMFLSIDAGPGNGGDGDIDVRLHYNDGTTSAYKGVHSFGSNLETKELYLWDFTGATNGKLITQFEVKHTYNNGSYSGNHLLKFKVAVGEHIASGV